MVLTFAYDMILHFDENYIRVRTTICIAESLLVMCIAGECDGDQGWSRSYIVHFKLHKLIKTGRILLGTKRHGIGLDCLCTEGGCYLNMTFCK